MFDLAQEEWDAFAAAVSRIARSMERKQGAFEAFEKYLEG